MKRDYKVFALILLLLLTGCGCACAQTATEVLGKAAAKINAAKGISCRFAVTGDAGGVSGNLLASGKRFSITSPSASVWYDGKTMWTLNLSSKEVTVTSPTSAEVAETNPLTYIHGYQSDYRVTFSKRKDSSHYLVLLNPKKKNTGVKAVEIDINKKSYMPSKIIVRFDDDRRAYISISSLNYNAKVSSGSFTFPVSRYKGYEIVDLR